MVTGENYLKVGLTYEEWSKISILSLLDDGILCYISPTAQGYVYKESPDSSIIIIELYAHGILLMKGHFPINDALVIIRELHIEKFKFLDKFLKIKILSGMLSDDEIIRKPINVWTPPNVWKPEKYTSIISRSIEIVRITKRQ